tara:strand:- start:93 stop:323 length:231 start_codon:yes stop_codon:yes gene_type:complete
MRGRAKQSLPSIRLIIMQYCLNPRNQVPILIDDGTLDYVVQLPSGQQERFNREYVLDTYGDCAAGSLAQLLAKEIE